MSEKKPEVLPKPKIVRRPYTHVERRDVLHGAGLQEQPNKVHLYRIDEHDSGIIAGGIGTPTIRRAVLSAFTFAFEQCERYQIADPGAAYNRFPALKEASFDTFKPVFEKMLPAAEAAAALEDADRKAKPEIEQYAPVPILKAAPQNVAEKKKNKGGRKRNRVDDILLADKLFKSMRSWPDVTNEVLRQTGREYSSEGLRKSVERFRKNDPE